MAKSYLESLLAQNEKIEVVPRQHWFVLLRWIILEIILIFVIGIVATFAAVAFFPVAALLYLLLLVPGITLIRDALIWGNRQYVITNRRVILVAGTFNKRVTDSSLEKVNDVKMVQSVFGRLVNFGDLGILTAGGAVLAPKEPLPRNGRRPGGNLCRPRPPDCRRPISRSCPTADQSSGWPICAAGQSCSTSIQRTTRPAAPPQPAP